VVSPPALVATAITSIAFDHQLYLGATLPEIAREKAGIIKSGVPIVVGPLELEAAAVIDEVARERGAEVVRAAADDLGDLTVGLRGSHQRANAAVALRLLQILDSRAIRVPRDAVARGLAEPGWPGRLDLRRLSDGREALLDAAHNPAGASALASYLRREGGTARPLVFAAMRDKDISGMFTALLPAVGSLIVTRASNPRSAEVDQLAQLARAIAPDLPIAIEPAIAGALATAWRQSSRIVIAGSIFLLGDVMKLIEGT
jgi:dihydrofolate synthase/folylpolyglutamate synthase